MPPPWTPDDVNDPAPPRLQSWVRFCLVLMAAVLVGGFVLAVYLNPYKDGRIWFEGTHQQLGLPPCTVLDWFGIRCPSCGMTTSWAHMVRGQVLAAARANAGAHLPCGVAARASGRPLGTQD